MEEARRHTTLVRAHSGWHGVEWRELWENRELLGYLAWRDIRVRYKQTLLGAGWAVFQPLIQMVVFTVIFGNLLSLQPDAGLPYSIFSFSALVPWSFFSASLSGVASSLVGNSALLTKVYFPRLLIPLASVIARLVDFAIALSIVFVLMVWYQIPFTWAVFTLPLFLLLAICCALGVGLWLAAINVYYRDVQVLVPFLLTLWQFLSPVVYSSALVSGMWKFVYNVNPMAGVITGFRFALLGTQPPDASIWISVIACLVILISGMLIFQRTQRTLADVV